MSQCVSFRFVGSRDDEDKPRPWKKFQKALKQHLKRTWRIVGPRISNCGSGVPPRIIPQPVKRTLQSRKPSRCLSSSEGGMANELIFRSGGFPRQRGPKEGGQRRKREKKGGKPSATKKKASSST